MNIGFSLSDKISSTIKEHHKHVKIAALNDKYHVKIAVSDEPYPWYIHPNSDELLIVLEGAIRIEFEDGISHTREVHDSLFIPNGTRHQTIPIGRAVNLVIEDTDTETIFEDSESTACVPVMEEIICKMSFTTTSSFPFL